MNLKIPGNLPLSQMQPIQPPASKPIQTITIGGPSETSAGANFSDLLSSAIDQVEGSRNDANTAINRFISGEGDDLHSTILTAQRADLEFQMFMQVRNKVVSAYQEVMRMQM
ncbi:MAG TPA: flagellar hook-basal body complex protein FliE [Bryobacteraceae bacterium]|nr:flagellar hook-basal body complex protein FliE [Bryobacteraceae bacterium]